MSLRRCPPAWPFRRTALLAFLSAVLPAAAAGPALRLTEAQLRQAGVRLAVPVAAAAATAAAQVPAATLDLQGTVVAPPQAVELVSTPLGGVVQAVLAQPADALRAGQVVARLHSPALMATQREFLQLQLQAEQAADRLQRDEQLAADGIIATARLVEARNTERQARLAAQERRQALRLAGLSDGQLQALLASAAVQPGLSVSAGAAGRVVEVLVQPGQQVEAGAPLLRLARPLPLGLALQATADQAARLRPGARVQLRDCDLAGTVRGVVPAMQGSNQAVIVQVALARAADCVQPNQVVTARVAVPVDGPAGAAGGPAADAPVQLPAAALFQLDGQEQVFVQTAQGLRPQPVQVLARQGAQATVQGLPTGAAAVVAGVAALKGAWMGVGEIVPAAPASGAAAGAR